MIKANEVKLEEKSVNELFYGDGTVTDKTIKLNHLEGKNRVVGREVEQLELHFGLSDQENQYFQKLSGKQVHEVNKIALQVKLDSQLKPVLSIIPVYDISMSRDVIVQGRSSTKDPAQHDSGSDSQEDKYASSSEEPEIVEQADSNDEEQEVMNEVDTKRAQRIKQRQDQKDKQDDEDENEDQ